MIQKLKLKLNIDELKALNTHLFQVIATQQIEELRYYPQDFLICSCLHEIYLKTSEKVDDVRLFPSRNTNKAYTVPLTRSQALAVYCSIVEEPAQEETTSPTMAVLPKAETDSYESNFLRELYGCIHRTFLI